MVTPPAWVACRAFHSPACRELCMDRIISKHQALETQQHMTDFLVNQLRLKTIGDPPWSIALALSDPEHISMYSEPLFFETDQEGIINMQFRFAIENGKKKLSTNCVQKL